MVSLLDDAQSRKPHLRLKGGVWSCAMRLMNGSWVIGYGYCFRTAWNDYCGQLRPAMSKEYLLSRFYD